MNSTESNSTTGIKLVVNSQISTNSNSTHSNSSTGIKLVVNDQLSTNTNSTDSNSTSGGSPRSLLIRIQLIVILLLVISW